MKQYIDMVSRVLEDGKWKSPVRKVGNTWEPVDGGIRTKAVPNVFFSHEMRDGFPLLTTKKMAWKAIRVELEGFIKGITDKQWFQDRNCKIWSEWCNPEAVEGHQYMQEYSHDDTMSHEESNAEYNSRKKAAQKELNCLGPIYGANWINFDGDYAPVPQITTGLNKTIKVSLSENCPFDLVGKEFNGTNGIYTVVSYDGKDRHCNCRFSVKFHTSGFVKDNLCKSQVQEGKIYDPYYPSVCGVACMGEYKDVEIPDLHYEEDKESTVEAIKNQWRQMIQRCYDKSNKDYKNYGAYGIYVHNNWLIFENFLRDIQRVNGWKFKLDNWSGYHLDKDINGLGFYGLRGCQWTTREDNANHTSQQYYFDAVDPNNNTFFNEYGLARFCRKYNLNVKTVEASIKSKTKTHGGWCFHRKENLDTRPKIKTGTNQLANIVETLRTNPMDRRMVCSAWNPNQIHMMALPPCHYAWNVTVIDNKVNLFWAQRSADLMLGVPFNIASYGLLLSLLAADAGLEVGNLSGVFVDCHIYENQLDGAIEQVQREPQPLPSIELDPNVQNLMAPNEFDIFNWTHDKVGLVGYNPLDKIDFGKVAV